VSVPRGLQDERGQASPEWIGLTLLVATLLAAALAGLAPLPVADSLGRAIAAKLVCAVSLSQTCRSDPELVAAYGAELAGAVRDHAPALLYENGMRALPVDFRSCRSAACSDGPGEELVWRSRRGERVTAFVHVVDCRAGEAAPRSGGAPQSVSAATCSGMRAGRLYLQYWLYYPDSATLRGAPVAGARGYHRDDWEGYQVRIGPGKRAEARASSHHGYNYEKGTANWGSDAGIAPLKAGTEAVGMRNVGGWGPETGALFVSGGSHAGNAKANLLRYSRLTPADRLRLIPLEALAGREAVRFAVTPPWHKRVWRDPEAEGTD
jgi:hypothetical protein